MTEIVRSEGWYRSCAGQDAIEDEPQSEFGVTLADAGKLLRKAKRVWIMFPIGPDREQAIFAVSKAAIRKEIEFYHGGTKTYRPCELDHSTHDGPTLIFGSGEANRRAAASHKPGMAT